MRSIVVFSPITFPFQRHRTTDEIIANLASRNQGKIEELVCDAKRPTEGEAMTTQVMHSGADELGVQRRDICAQHASQGQQ